AADALRLRAADLPGPAPTALVANLPYNVAVPVVLHLLALLPGLRRGLVMVQAEVAERLGAAPGRPADGRRVGSVSRSVFWPVPNVDSGLVSLERRQPPAVPAGVRREDVFAVVDAAF